MSYNEVEYCNWSFDECLKPKEHWLVKRDCEEEPIILKRGDTRNWRAYMQSLQPQVQTMYTQPRPGAQCPNCGKEINGVNPYDDGETWRR